MGMNKVSRQTLQRKQIEARLKKLGRVHTPPGGWIKALSESLGMTTRQLAIRIGVSQPAVMKMHKGEVDGTISLNSLRKVAEALGCDLHYALAPKTGALSEIIDEQAAKVAKKIIKETSHTMDLEKQGLSEKEKNQQIKELTEKLIRELPNTLWRDK